jgi:antitoxin FitA
MMANLSIRRLDAQVYEQLRARAADHSLSIEEEARRIISQAVSAPPKISAVFKAYFGPEHGIDLDVLQRKPHNPMDFDL